MKLSKITFKAVFGLLIIPESLWACTDITADVTGYVSTNQAYTSNRDDVTLARGNKDSFLVPLKLEQAGFSETDMTLLLRRVEENSWRVDFINDFVTLPLERRQILGSAGMLNFDNNGKLTSPISIFTLPASSAAREKGSTITVQIHDIELTSGTANFEVKLAVKDNVRCSDHGKIITIKNTADPAVHDELNPITKNAERAFIREH